MPRKMRLTVVVACVVLAVVMASSSAIADSVKSGCGTCPTACAGAAPCGGATPCGGGCAAKMSGGRSTLMTHAYSGGVVKVRVGCGGCCSLMLGVFKQGNRLDPNASVSAVLKSCECTRTVEFRQMEPGVYCAKADLTGATSLGVWVSVGALADYLQFDLGGKSGACKTAGGCQMTGDGKCSGMAAGSCATMGACRPAAAKTAACKCAVCKCSPCKCSPCKCK